MKDKNEVFSDTTQDNLTCLKRPIASDHKDSIYSWLVLASVFLAMLICIGMPLSFGIFFTDLQYEFSSSGSYEVAAVGSVAYGVLNFAGPFSSKLCLKYGYRYVIVLGSFLSSAGLALSFLAPNLICMYFSYGVITGLGYGLVFTSCLAVLPQYFQKYCYFATSFATVGSAVGTLVIPQVLYSLVQTYSWRGAMLISSGLTLQIVVCGSLLRPISLSPRHNSTSKRVKDPQKTINQGIWQDARLYLACLDSAFFGGSSYTVFSLTSSFAISRGLTTYQAASLISIIGASNLISRLATSFVGQSHYINRPLFFSCLTCLAGFASLACAISWTFWGLVVALSFYGLAYGGRISQMTPMLIDVFGTDKLATVIGYYLFAGGFGAAFIPIGLGKVYDVSGSIVAALVVSSSVCLVGSILCFITTTITMRKNLKT